MSAIHPTPDIDELRDFLAAYRSLFVLTGAGISTASGIPDYRDARGDWKRAAPIQYRDFVDRIAARKRYWARSLVAWPAFQCAQANPCHTMLATWEQQGRIGMLVTQNVDGLHQRAGSRHVIDLHGRLDEVVCLDCGERLSRAQVQDWLAAHNPDFVGLDAELLPDGDAALVEHVDAFEIPRCPACNGTLKPDVVFFGESVPRQRVDDALAALRAADALLVVGSSLMVYSGYRFCRAAAELGLPQAAINPGRTRADDLFDIKLTTRCEDLAGATGDIFTSL